MTSRFTLPEDSPIKERFKCLWLGRRHLRLYELH